MQTVPLRRSAASPDPDEEDVETTIAVHVTVTSRPSPGKLYGPPEDCFPPEPMEWEYTTTPADVKLTPAEREEVEDEIERGAQ